MRNLEAPHAYPEVNRGPITAAMTGSDQSGGVQSGCVQSGRDQSSNDEAGIDPRTLAGLDIGLYRALEKIGTPRQRICSALWLSYAEYDYIASHPKVLNLMYT